MSPHPRWMSPVLSVLVLLLLARSLQAQKPKPGTDAIDPPTPTWSVAVTPDGTTLAARPVNSSPFMVIFTVKNTGNQPDNFTLSCSGTIGITCQPLNPATLALGAGISSTVKVWYSTGPTTGTGRLNLNALGTSDAWNGGYFNQPIISTAPLVSLAPYNPGARDLTDCVAACLSKVWSHSTPEYYLMDQTRSFTLIYQSGRARPISWIQVDVSPGGTGELPSHYQVEVRRASDNVLLTLLNGATSVYYNASSGTQRLVAAFDRLQNNLATRDVAVTVTVTAHFPTAPPGTTTVATNAIGIDRSLSVFGAGFWPAGVQQSYGTSVGRLVAEGEGPAFLFANGAIPGGTSTTITASAPTWVRRTYLDGSYLEFDYNTGYPNRGLDRFGNTTTYFWTGDRLDSIGIPLNKRFRLGYDASGRLATLTDPAGRVTRYTVDAQNRLTRIEDPDGRATTLSYGANGLLVGVTGRNGAQWRTGYDAVGQIAADSAPAVVTYTGASKRSIVRYASDLTAAWQTAAAGTSTATAKGAVQGDTFVVRVTAPMGAVTKYSRDRLGLATKVVNHYGATTTMVRDTMGRPTSITEPNGHVRTNTFTGYLLTQTKDVTTGRTINYTYNARNDVTTISGDVVRRDFHYYNGESLGPIGALKQVYVGNTAAYPSVSAGAISLGVQQVHSDGRLALHRDNASHETLYGYAFGTNNLASVRDPRGNFTRWYYDPNGRLDSMSIPSSGVYAYTYGSLNQKLTEKNPLGEQITYQYDPQTLDLVRLTDAKGQIYKFSYNALGLLTAQHDLADTTKADSMWYDEEGNVRKLKTRRGDVIAMEYDLIGRLLARTGPNMPVDSFRYASNGRWMAAANANAYDSLAFDAAGRLVSQRKLIGNLAAVWQTSYDKRDRVITRQLSYAPTGYQSYSTYRYHSSAGVLDTVCTTAASCAAVTLDGELLPASTKYYEPGSGIGTWSSSQAFDPAHGVQANSFSPSTLNSQFGVAIGRDSLNRVKFRINNSGVYLIRAFQYDKLHRLVNSCDSTSGTIPCYNEYERSSGPAYAYDAAGNRTDPQALGVKEIGQGNRVYQFKYFTYGYDAAGNIISKVRNVAPTTPLTTYTWDARNRLTRVDVNQALVASFAYDAFGRRISKTTPNATERYVHDGDRVVLDVDAAGAVKNEYFHDPENGRLLMIKNTAFLNSWYQAVVLTDPELGTVRGLAKFTGGTRIKQYPDTPWGSAAADTGVSVRFRMAGQEFDVETGLYYMGARYYDPALGRFLSEDPIGVQGGLNLYSYANNDPINLADPSGLDPCGKGDKKKGCGGLPDIDVFAPIPRMPPIPHLPLPRSPGIGGGNPGQGGRGGGGAGAGGGRPAVSPVDPRKCIAGVAIAATNIAADVALFTGVGAVVRLGALAYGTGGVARVLARSTVRELASAELAASNAYWALAGSTAVRAGSQYSGSMGSDALISQGNGFNVGPGSFVPIAGSVFAVGDAIDACSQ